MERTVCVLGRRLAVAVMMAAALGFAVEAAHAGIRDMVKSAKDKATGQKPADSGLQPRKVDYDETMFELTGPVLDKLLAARQKANAGLKERPALVQRQGDIKTEIDALSQKHGSAITDNENKRYEVNSCVSGELANAQKRKSEEMQKQMMANPASMEKFLKLTAAMNDAQIKGDTAEVSRLNHEIEKTFGATHADSLEAQKKCGPMPPPHPAGLKIASLNTELAQVDAKIRTLDQQALKLQSDETGMTQAQVAMAWERIEMYCGGHGGFSSNELSALTDRKAALSAALAG